MAKHRIGWCHACGDVYDDGMPPPKRWKGLRRPEDAAWWKAVLEHMATEEHQAMVKLSHAMDRVELIQPRGVTLSRG
jgi:hypothetical protein